jgi:NAD+ synthase (glutamine-hydrolysing)
LRRNSNNHYYILSIIKAKMKVALVQYNFHVGNFDYNINKIIEGIEKAKQQGADLAVFSEMTVCGYPSGDFLEFSDYINKCYEAIDKIKLHCDGIAAIIGAPDRNTSSKGKPLFNAAFFLQDKSIKQVYHKGLLPNYDVFDEYRYFEPATDFETINFKGYRIALTICEDLWNLNDNPLYVADPMKVLSDKGADFMVNIAASPFSWHHDRIRKKMLSQNAKAFAMPLLYVNQLGAQTELIFDGGSMVFDKAGNLVQELNYFEDDLQVIDVNELLKNQPQALTETFEKDNKSENIYKAIKLGISDYFRKMGFSKAILGLSGGIDSAVTMAIAADALGPENVLGVLMLWHWHKI